MNKSSNKYKFHKKEISQLKNILFYISFLIKEKKKKLKKKFFIPDTIKFLKNNFRKNNRFFFLNKYLPN